MFLKLACFGLWKRWQKLCIGRCYNLKEKIAALIYFAVYLSI